MHNNFFNLSLDILCTVYPDGTFKTVNPAFCEMLGFNEEELKTYKIFDLIHPDDLNRSIQACSDTYQRKEFGDFTNRYISREGKVHHISWRTRYIESEDLVYASGRDVTETLEFQAKLNDTLNLLNYTGSIAKVGGWDLIIETGKIFWTDETYKILEIDPKRGRIPTVDETIGLFIGEHQTLYSDVLNHAFSNGVPYDLELKMKTMTGREIWVFVSGRPVFKGNKVTRLSGVIQNIDDKKKAEEALQKEHQTNLLQSKLAAIGELAAGVGHEINNPLMIAFGGIAQLKSMNELTDEASELIETIENAHQRIKRITHGLSDLSRRQTTKSLFDLKETIEAFLLFIQNMYKLQDISLNFETSVFGEAKVHGNRAEFQQVLLNLVSNAKDATEGMSERKICLELLSNQDSYLLKVTDNGRGTGLGLSLAHQIVKNHEGDIYFETQRDKGTTFFVRLPKADGGPLEKKMTTEELKLNHQGLRVLVIDDEDDIRIFLKLSLVKLSCEVVDVNCGKEALSILQKQDFDLIISDIVMPEMTGIEFIKLTEKQSLKKGTKILFLTGQIIEEEKLKGLEVNYDGLLMKPFAKDELIGAINSCYDKNMRK